MDPWMTFLQLAQELWGLAAAIIAGVGSFFLGYRRFKREEKETADQRLDRFYNEIEKENVRLRQKLNDIEIVQSKLIVDYTEMKTKWETILGSGHKDISIEKLIEFGVRQKRLGKTLEEFTNTFPGLLWMKEVEKDHSGKPKGFRVFALSQKYADAFLNGNRLAYLNKVDHDVWENDIAEQFFKNDLEAYNSRESIFVIEKLSTKFGKQGLFVGYKWNLSVEGIDYVCGYGSEYEPNTKEYDYWLTRYNTNQKN